MRNLLITSHAVVFFVGTQLGYLYCLTCNNISFKIQDDNEWIAESASSSSAITRSRNQTIMSRSNTAHELKEHRVAPVTITSNDNTNNKHNKLQIPRGTKFCLIHVGKTAGRSIACELGEGLQGRIGKDLLCYKYDPKPSALKHAFIGRNHVWGPGCENEKFSAFIYTLRNPLDRLISWYFYEHPDTNRSAKKSSCVNDFFKWTNSTKGCFSSVEEFALHAIPPDSANDNDDDTNNNVQRSNCSELAWKVATGEKKCYAHNGLGYAYYYRRMHQLQEMNNDDNSNIAKQKMIMLAIRTEHLIQDWNTLDSAFGGKRWRPNGSQRFRTISKSQAKPIKTSNHAKLLSTQGRKNLCHALCFEIQVYKTMLFMAKNLNRDQVRESMQEVIDSCPDETFDVRTCPPPNFAPLLYSIRKPFKDPIQCQCTVSPY